MRKRDIREDLNERISMHVKFMSYKIDKVISEELVRNLFSIYGEVCDTTIKQISIDRVKLFTSSRPGICYLLRALIALLIAPSSR